MIPCPTTILLKKIPGSSNLNTLLRYNFSSQTAEINPSLTLCLGTTYFFLHCSAATLYLNTMSKKSPAWCNAEHPQSHKFAEVYPTLLRCCVINNLGPMSKNCQFNTLQIFSPCQNFAEVSATNLRCWVLPIIMTMSKCSPSYHSDELLPTSIPCWSISCLITLLKYFSSKYTANADPTFLTWLSYTPLKHHVKL